MRDTARGAIVLLLCAPAFVWTAELLAGTPALILAAAAVPAALFAALVLAVQQYRGRPLGALALAFAWGATTAAWASTTSSELARPWIDSVSSGDDRVLTAILVAPLLEEAVKALGLFAVVAASANGLRDARDGIVHGALVGIGFVATENLLYLGVAMLQGGEAGLARALWLRGIVGASAHAVFSACAGAGIGWWLCEPERRFAPVLGFVAAHTQHVVWNAFAATAIAGVLCGPGPSCVVEPGPLAVFGYASAVAFVFLAPGTLALVAVWKRSPSERKTLALP